MSPPTSLEGRQPEPAHEIQRLRVRNLVLVRALACLSDDERRLLELRGIEHLGFDEIALRLERDEDAVRKLYAHALVVLARGLSAGAR